MRVGGERLPALPNVIVVGFCPEEFPLGTQRELRNIHGGEGFGHPI